MRSSPLLLALTAAILAAGCQHDYRLYTTDPMEQYDRTLSETGALALDSGGRRRLLLQSAESEADKTLGGGSLLLYLSFKIDPVHGIDLRHPKVFASLSNLSLSYSGFLAADQLKDERSLKGERVSGTFAGTLRAEDGAATRDVKITLDKTPVSGVRSREEIERKGYADIIRGHLYTLDFDAKDREYWRAPDAPKPTGAPAEGAVIPNEHK